MSIRPTITRVVLTITAALSTATAGRAADSLENAFSAPSHEAQPRTFWFWMNGHVSRDGITRDLEAMHRVGIGGVLIYDGGAYLPAGPVGFLQPAWRELMAHTIAEGKRLGVEIGIHNAPGWSSTGGPWITPELSMQQLVWTETTVTGGSVIDVVLPHPQTNEGYYRDAFVLAFPAAGGEQIPYEDSLRQITSGTQPVDKKMLSDGLLDPSVSVTPDAPLNIEFCATADVQAVTVNTPPRGRFPRLRLEASDDGRTYHPVCTITAPGRHGIIAPGAQSFPVVHARFFRLTSSAPADISELVLHRSPRLADWVYKANFAYRIGQQIELPSDQVTPGDAIDPASVKDLSAQMDAQGHLRWKAPSGTWTILRFGQTSTGQLNISASSAGTGLECDKFNPEATEFHFHKVVEQILADAGPAASGFTSVSIDSYEAGMQNWTAKFPEEFRRRAGYDIRGYLPAMTGRMVENPAISERFLYDLRRVQADLMSDAYYKRMGELCHARGLKYYLEGYGQGVFDEMTVSGLPDVPMGEFWTRTPWAPNRTVKMVASAAHIYGRPIMGAEAFTGEERTSRWLDYPYSMKVLGDDMFSLGVNQFTFHRYAHQPHPTAVPGMAMGPWGFNFERTNTWFEESKAWIDYLTRAQSVLQQGIYGADILYFVGERPPNNAQFMMPALPAGYNYDLVTADALLNRVTVQDREFVFPNGARYRILVLPAELKVVTPELMRKLREFVTQGATVLGPKPIGSPTLRGFPDSDIEVRRIADELWPRADGAVAPNSDSGSPAAPKARVIADRSVSQVIEDLKLEPDFQYTSVDPGTEISWCHRHLPDADVYFVANRHRRVSQIVGSFRIRDRTPELWNPESGEQARAAVFAPDGDRTKIALRLEPAESVFVVFRRPATSAGQAWAANKTGKLIDLAAKPALPPAVTQTFTMSVWAKPDTELRLMPHESATGRADETGKFYAIAAAEGDVVYGAGHAIAGLAVGRNGAYVIERSRSQSPAVLVVQRPISGWTHFAVVYRNGVPRLYIDGQFVHEGRATGSLVHPGIGSPPPRTDTVYYFAALDAVARQSHLPLPPSQGRAFLFEGNETRAELFNEALSDTAVAELAHRGLPPPEAPTMTLATDARGVSRGQFWKSGQYTFASGAKITVDVPSPRTVGGPWRISFEPDRGAPAAIVLPELASLHRLADPGVKYFSGTATYANRMDLPAEFLGAGKRVILDLGRVEVIAEVSVNGRKIGTAWKEPYRLDITDAVHAGENHLEIAVTDLWANRLIGDEQLPAENQYATGGEHGILRVPDWYLRGQPKPAGGRTTFVTWHFYDKDEPLVEAGLLGPVRVFCVVERQVE